MCRGCGMTESVTDGELNEGAQDSDYKDALI